MQFAIAGGGAAGLSAGLLLAGDGHHVVVLDRDPLRHDNDHELGSPESSPRAARLRFGLRDSDQPNAGSGHRAGQSAVG